MTILDLINKSAVMLNIPEVLNDEMIANLTVETEQEILTNNFAFKRLYEFSKIVLNEINSYMPRAEEVVCKSVDKKISLENFVNMSKIIGVKGQYGYVKYLIVEDLLVVEEDDTYTIIYEALPNVVSVLDEITLSHNVAEDMLVYGLNAYYCLAVGLFSEFNIYNEHYHERLNKLKNLKVFAMPCRSWR